DRLGRRARALPAGAQGRAGAHLAGGDAGLRRGRQRHRRRGRGRGRRAAAAPGTEPPGAGGDALAASGGQRPAPLARGEAAGGQQDADHGLRAFLRRAARGDRAHALRQHDHRGGARRRGKPDGRRRAVSAKSRPAAPKPVEAMTEKEAAAELKRLAAEIAHHDRLYHQQDMPEVSDAEYDALRRRNAALEARFPELVRADSPSRRIGAAPAGGFAKVPHALPMLSLDNAFDESDVRAFFQSVRNYFKRPEDLERVAEDKIGVMAEPKIDGLSSTLRYEEGRLVLGATRGDGVV